MMNNNILEEAKAKVNLLEYIENSTTSKVKRIGKSVFINPCPFCGHNDHFTVDVNKNIFNSFNNTCCTGGSIIDFIVQYENISVAEAINKVIDLAGENRYIYNVQSTNVKEPLPKVYNEYLHEEEIIFDSLIDYLHENVNQTEYYTKRGLTEKTIKKYKLGYSIDGLNYAISKSHLLKEQENNNYKAYKYYLPIWNEDNKCDYFFCRLDEDVIPEGKKMSKTHNLKGYPAKLLNDRYLSCDYTDNTIFIVEGYFDALSLEELDYKAIALNSVGNVNTFINKVKENLDVNKNTLFVLVPDNDNAGHGLQGKLMIAFHELKLNLEICKLPDIYKDTNDFLREDRDGFATHISKFLHNLKNTDYNSSYISTFLDELQNNQKTNIISTGFEGLDKALGGGLYPGLYTIGAIPSLGKTTFIQQIGDYIAKDGTDVLFFSLEMGKNQLIRKSLSREIFLLDSSKAVSSQEIQQGKYDKKLLYQAIEKYQNIGENLATIEGGFELGVQQIRERVNKNLVSRRKNPVVIVDYLQILRPYEKNMSDKQMNDYNITGLKKISRDFNIPVIIISSLNRMNYTSSIGYESFKETGAIEYSSDVVMGLQFRGIDDIASSKSETEKRNKVNDLKAKNPREIEVVIIKQRDGLAFCKQDFRYYAKYNYFCEI